MCGSRQGVCKGARITSISRLVEGPLLGKDSSREKKARSGGIMWAWFATASPTESRVPPRARTLGYIIESSSASAFGYFDPYFTYLYLVSHHLGLFI